MNRLQRIAQRKVRHVIGLNSGTSADGVDTLLLEVRGAGWSSRLRAVRFRTYPFPPRLKRELTTLLARFGDPGRAESAGALEVARLHARLGDTLGRAAARMQRWGASNDVSCHLVGSHGQTVWHAPGSGGRATVTVQLGDPHRLAARTGLPAVADFRQSDVAAGGQGAPLTPALDYLLFHNDRRDVVTLNLGGIANYTAIRAGGGPRAAGGFDAGPCNLLLDGLYGLLVGSGYDRGGRLAARGRIRAGVAEEFLRHSYFRRRPPKSTGREEFGPGFAAAFRDAVGRRRPAEDHLATAADFVARAVAGQMERFLLDRYGPAQVVVSGGGIHHRPLRAALEREFQTSGIDLVPFMSCGLTPDSKEAALFAWLASEAVSGRAAHLPHITGAAGAQVLGVLVP
ncbi:MAG: anhydro-N-acetylmuramic acid kinase [Candidatus Eisenbacteria bacterium]|nr:anhydro-N-acetylmuramic acid kinase [Candidatus Eisenbacteria bacterium]